jgi:hypothetical protein
MYYHDYDLRYFLDWKVLGGYDTSANRGDVEDSVKVFYERRSQLFDERLRFWIDDTINKIATRPVGYSFEDFVSFRDAWCTSGSAVGGKAKKMSYRVKGDVRKVRCNTKWFATVDMSDGDIVKRCEDEHTRVVVKPFVKSDEPGAFRTVQGYDMYSLIRVSYLEEAIKDLNGNGLWTSIGMTAKKRMAMAMRISAKDGMTRLCTDQSSFDQNQNLDWIKYAMKRLVERLSLGNHDDIKRIGKLELASLERVVLKTKCGAFPWKQGILSGYKWTALLDSILNRAATRWVLEKLDKKIYYEMYQGDDAIVKVASKVDRLEIARCYEELGLKVNPSKTWVSDRNCEYLHELYIGSNLVSAFPARSVKSLIWEKPVTGGVRKRGEDKTRAYLSNCLMAARRGLEVFKLVRRFMRERMPKLDDQRFYDWYLTPTVLGGFGGDYTGRTSLKIKKREGEYRQLHYDFKPWRDNEIWRSAVKRRSEGVVARPGVRYDYSFSRVRCEGKMDESFVSERANEVHWRTDWLVTDLQQYSDAYERKLKLEWKLGTNLEIAESDLPLKIGFGSGLKIDRIYRQYRRLIGTNFSMESLQAHEIFFSGIKSMFNNVWAAICSDAILSKKAPSSWGFRNQSSWDWVRVRRAVGGIVADCCRRWLRHTAYRVLT